jgi:hypothetical protein
MKVKYFIAVNILINRFLLKMHIYLLMYLMYEPSIVINYKAHCK